MIDENTAFSASHDNVERKKKKEENKSFKLLGMKTYSIMYHCFAQILKSVSKILLPGLQNFITSRIFGVEA